jgi:hypothetical protein
VDESFLLIAFFFFIFTLKEGIVAMNMKTIHQLWDLKQGQGQCQSEKEPNGDGWFRGQVLLASKLTFSRKIKLAGLKVKSLKI